MKRRIGLSVLVGIVVLNLSYYIYNKVCLKVYGHKVVVCIPVYGLNESLHINAVGQQHRGFLAAKSALRKSARFAKTYIVTVFSCLSMVISNYGWI